MAADRRSCRARSTPWLRPEPSTPPRCFGAGGGGQTGPDGFMLQARLGLGNVAARLNRSTPPSF
jgi:hypothetical protein